MFAFFSSAMMYPHVQIIGSYMQSGTFKCLFLYEIFLCSTWIRCWYFYLQRPACKLYQRLPYLVYTRLLRHIHFYANIYDSSDHIHVTSSRSAFWSNQRSGLGFIYYNYWCIILLFLVKNDWKAHCFLVLARETKIFSSLGIYFLYSTKYL